MAATSAGSGAPGDISRANATKILVPVGPGPTENPVSCSTSTDPIGYAGEMTVVCDFTDIPLNAQTVLITVAGGYYVDR